MREQLWLQGSEGGYKYSRFYSDPHLTRTDGRVNSLLTD